MQSGLITTTEADTASNGAGNGVSQHMDSVTEDANTVTYTADQPGQPPVEAMLAGTAWTREDLVAAATVLNTVLFAAVLYVEVKK